MKNNFSRLSKNIILITVILIIAILTSFYGININKFVEDTGDFLDQEANLGKTTKAKLVDCIDGDTAKLKVGNQTIKVRLLAVDTPEVTHAQLYSKEASDYTCKSLKKAKNIKIQYEKDLTKQDKYKRHLVWIYVDDSLLQEKLVQNGYAKVRYIYAKYTYTDKLLKLQKEAKNNHVRIWQSYEDETSNSEIYYVVFENEDSSKTVEVKNGEIQKIIDNPIKRGYTFTGWTKNNKLYDLSQSINKNVVVKAKFKRK